ncbi:Mu transposase C-terminal domain-containing protein [Kordiimonas laminariae]|uniref:Mu transposase C-terminal domain-containing protein n=1 Tax=Kordiimonas laminariae TaxID=2917717 RepID=UPI001FF4D570|nr:Mu transposase C-terminal domain-containing protein [Kordiimonas laminariae]MCK0069414.1 Mu transposase C-terminal domain-containing protein [Kordiimonas laminariae]
MVISFTLLKTLSATQGTDTRAIPGHKNDWPVAGTCETLIVDNGREFHSDDLDLACQQLNIDIEYAPRAKPWYKGKIERFFHTLDLGLTSQAKGRTIAKFLSKLLPQEEYDPKEDAVVDLATFVEVLNQWIVDVYAQKYHRELSGIPIQRWNEGMETNPLIKIPSSSQDLLITLSKTESRKIHTYGIELNSLRYNSPALGALRMDLYKGNKNPDALIKLDPSDISHIHVYDPNEEIYIKVPALDMDYARSLGLWHHKIIKKYAAKLKDASDRDVSLAEAREQIRDKLSGIQRSAQKVSHQKKIARSKGIGSNQYQSFETASVEPPAPEPLSETEADGFTEQFQDDHDFEDDYEWGISSNENFPE